MVGGEVQKVEELLVAVGRGGEVTGLVGLEEDNFVASDEDVSVM